MKIVFLLTGLLLLSCSSGLEGGPIGDEAASTSSGTTSGEVSSSKNVSSPSQASDKLAVYVVAHQDDWQLFMGDRAIADMRDASTKTIFVYLTAGHAGKESSFWLAREAGAVNSIYSALDLGFPAARDTSREAYQGMKVFVESIQNTKSYFLRLPDGNWDGSGFENSDFESLKKLYADDIPLIRNLHEKVQMTEPQVVAVLKEILADNFNGQNISIHLQEHDLSLDPNNHSDHIHASLLAQKAFAEHKAKTVLYRNYSTASATANISGNTLKEKTQLFDAYDEQMVALAGYNTRKEEPKSDFDAWISRTYSRPLEKAVVEPEVEEPLTQSESTLSALHECAWTFWGLNGGDAEVESCTKEKTQLTIAVDSDGDAGAKLPHSYKASEPAIVFDADLPQGQVFYLSVIDSKDEDGCNTKFTAKSGKQQYSISYSDLSKGNCWGGWQKEINLNEISFVGWGIQGGSKTINFTIYTP